MTPLEPTSRHFCTRAKPSCKRSKTFCTRCKPAWSNFKALLFIMQNRHANVQVPFDHDANRLEATSKPFCTRRKTSMQVFSAIVHDTKPYCLNDGQKVTYTYKRKERVIFQTRPILLFKKAILVRTLQSLQSTTQTNLKLSFQHDWIWYNSCLRDCKCSHIW